MPIVKMPISGKVYTSVDPVSLGEQSPMLLNGWVETMSL